MARPYNSADSESTQSSDGSDVKPILKIKLNFTNRQQSTPKIRNSRKVPNTASSRLCPFQVLGVRRNEARTGDINETLSDILHMMTQGRKTGLPINISRSDIMWAVRFLRNPKRRLNHEAKARQTRCSCRTAWERLSDAQQAYLIKHSDGGCHQVPEASNPIYNSLDQDIPDHDYGHEWLNMLAIKENYDPIWEKFDNYREDDDEIPPCNCSECKL